MTPSWLQAAALLLWGFAIGHWLPGAILAAVRLLVSASGVHLDLGDRRVSRAVDVSALAVVLTVVSFAAGQGVPTGLYGALGWLPAVLFPLLLIEALRGAPLRMRHLSIIARRSGRAAAERPVHLGTIYFLATLLAASVKAEPASSLVWGLAALMVAWLLVERQRSQLPRAYAAVFLAATLALAGAYGLGVGLQRAQGALQEWGTDLLSDTDTDPYQSRTRIGDLGRLKLSGQILWRVEQSSPPVIPLRLRTGVFSTYLGGTWFARQDSFHPLAHSSGGSGPPSLRLHGRSVKGLALIPVPPGAQSIDGDLGRLERNAYGVVRASDAPPLLEAAVRTSPAYAGVGIGDADLAVPPGFSGLFRRLPELAALEKLSEPERVAGLQAWFAGNFRYTLFLGDAERGARDLERFLLTDRAGHCEYFATSTVLLLRALGIPARYVTGFVVEEYSQRERAFLIRQRHAHAWAEALVNGHWIEVDTTPSGWILAEEDTASLWQPVLDLANFAWFRFSQWRRDFSTEEHPWLLFAPGIAMILVIGWLGSILVRRLWKSRRSPRAQAREPAVPVSAQVSAFRELERELAALALGRAPTEPARAWLNRVAREGASLLGEHQLHAAREIVEALYRDRYAR